MPKYSFKSNFFPYRGGCDNDPDPTHTLCQPHSVYDKKHWINVKFKIFISVLAFLGLKNFYIRC